MKTLLLCCLLWALLETGTSISCEVCHNEGDSCTGPVQVCSKELDSCGIIKVESMRREIKTTIFVKACMFSSLCNLAPLYVTIGNKISFSGKVACCVGEACKTATVNVLPDTTTLNGQRCPACESELSHHCSKEEIMNCTGTQTHCLHVSNTEKIGERTINSTMKGCASKSTCTNMQQFKGIFKGFGVDLTTAECSRASSRMATVALEPARLVLPALLTILLVNGLS